MATAVMAVWNNREGGSEADYESWYQEEHVPQRLAFAGFRGARRYEAVAAERRYFTWYGLDSVAVLHQPDYLACLAEPTPRTRAAMPSFRDMIRSELNVAGAISRGAGGYAVTLRWDEQAEAAVDLGRWMAAPGVVAVRHWVAPPGPPPAMSEEVRFRGAPDRTAAGALVIECLREADAAGIAATLAATLAKSGHGVVGQYRLLCCFGQGLTSGQPPSDSGR